MKSRITIIVLILFSFSNCASLQLDKHNGFWEWFIGKPGALNAAYIPDDPIDVIILEERHPFYLWFRTPELILNLQGGIYYPDARVKKNGKFYNTNNIENIRNEKLKRSILVGRNANFHRNETGFVDFIIPYREIFDPSGENRMVVLYCVFSPILLLLSLDLADKHDTPLIARMFIYPIHDVIKTVMIPVAAVYYTVKAFDDNGEE
ncbi:MAG: hypothetical protein KDK90_27870, partial [Leptospiraceae bacterium]|nr:hypothetical protein [Leptospiraceae bacterium]